MHKLPLIYTLSEQFFIWLFKTYGFCEYNGFKWMITATGKLISILIFTKVQGGGIN